MSVLIRSTWRDLVRQRWAYASIAVTMFLGVGLFAASYDAFLNLEASYEHTYERLAFADLTATGGDVDGFAAAARATEGVAAVTVRRTADVPLRIGGDHVLLGRVVELTGAGEPQVNRVSVLEGSMAPPTEIGRSMAERHLAEHFELDPGDSVEVYADGSWQTLDVTASVASAEYLWPARSRQDLLTSPDDFGVLFVTTPAFDAINPEGAVDEVVVAYASTADPDALTEQLTPVAAEADATVVTRAEQPSNAALQEDVSGFGELSFMFPVLFLGAAALATSILLSRLVRARRSEIATLRANGMASRQVVAHFLGRGLVLSVLAGALGLALGLVAGRQVTALYTAAVDVPDTTIDFHVGTVIAGLAMSALAGAIAAAGPTVLAARTPPAVALRGAPPPGRGGRSRVERWFPPARRLPARWRMVLRGIGREPRRSMSTIVGVVLSLVLILAAWGMLDTVEILLDRQFNDIQRQDAQIYVDRSADDAGAAIASTPGVERVERVGQVRATLSGSRGQYTTEVFGFPASTTMHGFGSTGPPEDGLVVGRSMHDLLGVDVGDAVTVGAAGSASTMSLPIDGFVDEPLGTFAYAEFATVESLVDASGRSSFMVDFGADVDRDEMRRSLTRVPGVVAYVDSRALYDTADELMSLFRVFVGVMLAFGAIMAFALIVSTTNANAAERSVELAALRVNGASRSELGRLLATENLLLTLAAVGPGLVVGWAVAAVFMSSFSSDLFDLGLHIRTTTFAAAAVAVLAVSIVAQWPAIRLLGRLDVAEVARSRAQ